MQGAVRCAADAPRCADGEQCGAGSVACVSWMVWLLIPVAVTAVAAIVSWLHSRPDRRLKPDDAMRAHGDYLDALAQTARSKDRGPLVAPPPD